MPQTLIVSTLMNMMTTTNLNYERVDNLVPLLPTLSSVEAITLEEGVRVQIESGIYLEQGDFNLASLVVISEMPYLYVFPQPSWEEGQLTFDVLSYKEMTIEKSEQMASVFSTNKLLPMLKPRTVRANVEKGTNLISVQYQ